MAKGTVKIGGTARVRFVVVDAELPDGDIGAIAQVLQNALRSPSAGGQSRNGGANQAQRTIAHQVDEPSSDNESAAEDEAEEIQSLDPADTPQRRGPRKPAPTPNVVEIDMESSPSLEAFSRAKDSKSQQKKYLIVAAWLKEHRGLNAITADHVYTCFRFMGWSTSIADFGQPLRNLKARKYLGSNERGEYEINHLGLDYVKKLGADHGTS